MRAEDSPEPGEWEKEVWVTPGRDACYHVMEGDRTLHVVKVETAGGFMRDTCLDYFSAFDEAHRIAEELLSPGVRRERMLVELGLREGA